MPHVLHALQLRPSVNRFNPSLLDSLNPGSAFFKDVVSPDRDRLLLRLDQYDLTEKKVEGDGACQVREFGFEEEDRRGRGRMEGTEEKLAIAPGHVSLP